MNTPLPGPPSHPQAESKLQLVREALELADHYRLTEPDEARAWVREAGMFAEEFWELMGVGK